METVLSSLVDVVRDLIEYVDDRCGRAAAWAVAIAACIALLALPFLIIGFLLA